MLLLPGLMNNLLLFLSFFLLFSITKSAIVSTSLGQIDGDQIGSFHLFKHIPLAKPPIGKLRFQKPEPPEKWTGVRNAKAYGPACISNSSVSTSPQKWIDEDCLHINIFTSDKCLKSKDCAVVTYFHGGGLMYDSAVMFNDTYLLGTFVNQDVIIAIPAFRLGIFSHFVVEDQSIAPTNLALYDILLGVEFVKNEIHNFGGNNQKNTIMGHSYGGSIVNILTFSSKINHDLSLFQQSICMSSGHDFETLEIQIQKTNRFAKHAGCTVPSIIEKKMTTRQSDLYRMKCLQNKDALELLRVQRLLEDEGYPTYGYLVQREPLIQEIPYQEFMKSPKKIPMLTGCTRYEMDHSPAPKPIGQALGFENPEEVYMKFRKDWDDEVYEFGNHSDETQAIMVQVRVRVNNLLSKNVPAYLYEYTYPKHARHTDASASNDPNKPTNNEIIKTPLVPPSPRGGLKRMAGMSQLKSTFSISLESQRTIPPPSSSSSFLSHSTSMVSVAASLKRAGVPSLTRTKTSALPIKMEKKPMVPLRIEQDHQTPIRKLAPESIPSLEDQVTPPMRRSSSGSMLLRQTPERIRRQEEDVETPGSPVKRYRRSGSMPRLEAQSLDVPIRMEIGNSLTPVLKRKRTSSLTCLFSSDMPPILTPQRLRPRGISETRTIDDDVFVPKSPTKKPITSPIKKRVRQDSENRSTSPLKKRYISSFSIRLEEEKEIEKAVPTPTMSTPMRKFKSTIFNPRAVTERIAQTYGTGSRQLLKSTSSTVLPAPPALVARSTSGETYYSATEGEDSILSAPPPQSTEVISIPKQDDLQRDDGKMVPLVKKQMSIDEKIMEDDEDEGFGDSMKTIKRGQGSSLARSLSLKLSPKTDQQKPIGADTEKSCSTPSLPTAPLLSRQGSTSSLRFKVSPSTFLKPIATPIIDVSPTPRPDPEPLRIIVAAAAAAPVESTELSEPSTSKTPEQKAEPAMQKSALRKHAANFSVREEIFIPGIRRKKIRFSGLHVHYFDRRQGGSTVPTEGDISLDMHNKHHSHRYFSLSTGKRPILDLLLYADDDLSDGEVIDPDSDEDRDYDEYASAKSIPRINQRHRIKLLKKSGVKVEKNTDAIDSLRNTRVECGCSCENGVCLPETCQCAIDGIHCQVDGGEWPTQPCACFAETCTNPEGRTFYDPEAVHEFRQRTIMNWRASQKTGISGSPVVKKFADSDEEDDKAKTWLLKNAIPIKLEESPTKYPVTPVYTRRSRSSLSDIRESTSETTGSITPSTSLSERIKAMQHLDNEVCVEQEEKDEDDAYFMDNKEDTIIEADLTLQEVYVEQDMVAVTVESSSETTDIDANEMIEATAMSPVKTTLVV